MFEVGYRRQVNVDFSPEAIRTMEERVKHEGESADFSIDGVLRRWFQWLVNVV